MRSTGKRQGLGWSAVGWAAVVAIGALLACGGGSNNGGGAPAGTPFPFSGPSCPSGAAATMPGMSLSSSCSQCEQSRCSTASDCFSSQCADYFNCFCPCAQNDIMCQGNCATTKLSTSCFDCIASVVRCTAQSCGSACGLDAGVD